MRNVSGEQSGATNTDEESLRQSVDSEITSIVEDEEDSVFNDQELGTGLTETSNLERQDAEIKNHDEPLALELLDDDQQEDIDTQRQTPEGQVPRTISHAM